jgi:cytochrome c553
MNKLLSTLLSLLVASVTLQASAQTSAPATAPKAEAPANPKTLEAKTAMCFGCHGIRGYQSSFPEVYKVPMISGQNAKYIVSALTAYKNGDRKHPTMRGIATSLSDQDMKDIAAFYEGLGKEDAPKLPDQPSRQPDAHVASLLQKAACVSCHGSNFSKPIDPSYPKIAGQHEDYLFVALKAYKTQGNPTFGRNNGVMGAIVKQFSNADLKALAEYVGSLDSELSVHPESRFRN